MRSPRGSGGSGSRASSEWYDSGWSANERKKSITTTHGMRLRWRGGAATEPVAVDAGSGSLPNGTRGTASRAVFIGAGSGPAEAAMAAATSGADAGTGAAVVGTGTGGTVGTGAASAAGAVGPEFATRLVQPPSQKRHS